MTGDIGVLEQVDEVFYHSGNTLKKSIWRERADGKMTISAPDIIVEPDQEIGQISKITGHYKVFKCLEASRPNEQTNWLHILEEVKAGEGAVSPSQPEPMTEAEADEMAERLRTEQNVRDAIHRENIQKATELRQTHKETDPGYSIDTSFDVVIDGKETNIKVDITYNTASKDCFVSVGASVELARPGYTPTKFNFGLLDEDIQGNTAKAKKYVIEKMPDILAEYREAVEQFTKPLTDTLAIMQEGQQ